MSVLSKVAVDNDSSARPVGPDLTLSNETPPKIKTAVSLLKIDYYSLIAFSSIEFHFVLNTSVDDLIVQILSQLGGKLSETVLSSTYFHRSVQLDKRSLIITRTGIILIQSYTKV